MVVFNWKSRTFMTIFNQIKIWIALKTQNTQSDEEWNWFLQSVVKVNLRLNPPVNFNKVIIAVLAIRNLMKCFLDFKQMSCCTWRMTWFIWTNGILIWMLKDINQISKLLSKLFWFSSRRKQMQFGMLLFLDSFFDEIAFLMLFQKRSNH